MMAEFTLSGHGDMAGTFLEHMFIGGGGPVIVANATSPEISNFSPAVGEEISASDTISFDVTDDEGLFERILIAVSFPDGTFEVAHDGDNPRGNYTSLPNARVSITNGFRYTLRRAGNWPSTPTFEYFVIDDAGNSGVIP